MKRPMAIDEKERVRARNQAIISGSALAVLISRAGGEVIISSRSARVGRPIRWPVEVRGVVSPHLV